MQLTKLFVSLCDTNIYYPIKGELITVVVLPGKP